MDLNKYKNLLFQKIKDQITVWYEENNDLFIANSEVYRFLHSINGSSGTLQLGGLYQLSRMLMDEIEYKDRKQWDKIELKKFLHELISLTYEYENFNESENNKELHQADNVPLIQIIDDDVSMLILLKDTLEEKGWMAAVNTDPEKAVSKYIDLQPDCVIIDVHLPNKNGFQVLEDLVSHNHLQFVPKVMISNVSNRETRIKALKMGADDFIEKPIDLEELTVRIERLLSRKKLYDQSTIHQPLEQAVKKTLFVSIIDDDDIVRSMLMRILGTMNFDHYVLNIEAFSNGIQFFESNRLELIGEHFLILDGVMPVMDGIEILHKVKKGRNILVLMLTGRKSESDIERALKLGADDYITKPFSIKELQARIQRLITRMK